jgi:hypothetical protein
MDASGIDVRVFPEPDQGQVYVSWTDARPPGQIYHVYAYGQLQDVTVARATTLPWPADGRMVVEVVAVDPGEAGQDFSGSLPAVPGVADRVRLDWLGGRYLDPGTDGLYDDVAEFRVFRSAAPGGSVDLSAPVATLPVFAGGIPADGFGVGGFGRGGFGRSQLPYVWTSGRLASGLWRFEVQAADRAGNLGASVLAVEANVSVRPRPPKADARGRRVQAVLNPDRTVTLTWEQE